jgi:N-acetylmuramoyl-L-alanine amidase-like protein
VARFACATWRPIHANTGGMVSPNIGLILHHAVMNGSGWNLFNNPSTEASAHFWVFKDGRIEQYVDTNVVAWHGRSLNSRYVGVETEGCPSAPHAEAMTEPMVAALGRLYAEGMRVHGWRNALANRDGEPGFGFHRMAVATACPCDVRLNMRQEILSRAAGGAPAPAPTPEPEPEGASDNMILVDPVTGGTWCIASKEGAVYTVGKAPYLGATNNNAMNAARYPCCGIGLRPNNDGYRIVLDWGAGKGDQSTDGTGTRFRTYDFPRNGSGAVSSGTY